jgi:hypothetical protein
MYVTVVVFSAGVLHHAPSHCHIHVVQYFISNTIIVCDSYLGVLHVVSEQWFWLQISRHQLDLARV